MNHATAASKSLAEVLADIMSEETDDWRAEVIARLSELSDDTLLHLVAQSQKICPLAIASLESFVHDYVYSKGTESLPTFEGMLDTEEFFLRGAFSLTPISVEIHRPMIGSIQRHYGGETEELGKDDLYTAVIDSVTRILDDLDPTERNLRLAPGLLMYEYFPQEYETTPDEGDVEWLADHAMQVLPYADRVFKNGFDRGLAENLLAVETVVLREGVL